MLFSHLAYNEKMDTRFALHNGHKEDSKNFQEHDSDLCKLKKMMYVHAPTLLQQLPMAIPGVYTLTGSCQTGKTTLLKLWMAKLLDTGISPQAITFLAADQITSENELIHLLQAQLANECMQYIIIDDVTYIHHWDKAIKFLIDTKLVDQAIIVLASSDNDISKKLQLYYPRRIDTANITDMRLSPLSFHEVVKLKYPQAKIENIDLFTEFDLYLFHGGYLAAINDIAMHDTISDKTLMAYADSLQRVAISQGKQKDFLREILNAIIEHYNKPITWNRLSPELSIAHTKTISDYITFLAANDVVFVQSALSEDTLKAAPKKARKLIFTDPFIFHAIRKWLQQSNKNFFRNLIKPILKDQALYTNLVKTCATTNYRRCYPTYYIKAESEIDLVYLHNNRFWPVVIIWTNLLRTKELKQILKYPNAKILTKAYRSGIIEHIRTEPLPQALWKLNLLPQQVNKE